MTIDQINLRDIYDFMETGNVAKAPEHIVAYLDLLDMVRGMFLRMDKWGSKESIIKHLMVSSAHKLSRYKANQVCDEAQEYFYRDSQISKSAWKNIYADKMEKMINFAMLTVKDVNDAQKVVKMLLDVSVLRGVNEEDKEDLPAEVFQPPFVVYTWDSEALEMPKVNRQKLAEMIDAYPELTEKEKIRIKQEALIPGFKLKIFPNEQEDPRKS
jgi:CRISPR/Cas system CSM-associated protein Csm2 small subunit